MDCRRHVPSTVECQGRASIDSLNTTAATLLGFLHTGEASGYELVAIADEVVGAFWTVTRSQV